MLKKKKVLISHLLHSRRTLVRLDKRGGGGGALHLEMRLPTLCFWSLEPRKFKRGVKNNAEVDATGRCIYTIPAGVQRAYYALMHTIVVNTYYIYQRRGCLFSALFILQVFLGP